jgi:hypothetical protein
LGDTPVTYSLTITNYPDSKHSGFQTHLFLISSPGNETTPDWNEPSVVFLQIQNNANGTATARFMYKTNDPGDNKMLWNTQPGGQGGTNNTFAVGTLAFLDSTNGPLGTWSLTFLNNTNITLTAPTGASTNFFFPDDLAIQVNFADPLTAYFGVQKNGANNAGQVATFSRVQVIHPWNPIDDTFPGPVLNSDPNAANRWRVVSDVPNDLYVVATNDVYWLSWTLPDLNFGLQVSPDLTANSWVDPSLTDPNITNTVVVGAIRKTLVPSTVLPSTNSSFFRMVKQVTTP